MYRTCVIDKDCSETNTCHFLHFTFRLTYLLHHRFTVLQCGTKLQHFTSSNRCYCALHQCWLKQYILCLLYTTAVLLCTTQDCKTSSQSSKRVSIYAATRGSHLCNGDCKQCSKVEKDTKCCYKKIIFLGLLIQFQLTECSEEMKCA